MDPVFQPLTLATDHRDLIISGRVDFQIIEFVVLPIHGPADNIIPTMIARIIFPQGKIQIKTTGDGLSIGKLNLSAVVAFQRLQPGFQVVF